MKNYSEIVADVWKKKCLKQISIDAKHCNFDILSLVKMNEFVTELISEINIVTSQLFPPMVINHPGEGDLGISVCQLWPNAWIVIRTVSKERGMSMDFFSLDDYDEDLIINLINSFFEPVSINKNINLREKF
jgi:hypothetical protein